MMGRRKAFRRRRGFTLVEILIASVVLLLFVGVVWHMMSKFSGSGVVHLWREDTGRELRQTSTRLRKAVEETSYPSGVVPGGNSTAKNEGYFVIVAGGGQDACSLTKPHGSGYKCRHFKAGSVGADQVILTLFKCRAARKGLSGTEDRKGTVIKTVCKLGRGENVRGLKKRAEALATVQNFLMGTATQAYDVAGNYMSRQPGEDVIDTSSAAYVPGEPSAWTPMIRTVSEVQVCARMTGSKTDADTSPFVEIRFTCIEPSQGRTVMRETIRAKPHVGVKFE